jgi:hypothetical protein
MSMITEIKMDMNRVADAAADAGVDPAVVDAVRAAAKNERNMMSAMEALRAAVAKTGNADLLTQVVAVIGH